MSQHILRVADWCNMVNKLRITLSGCIHETTKTVKRLILTLKFSFNLFNFRVYTGIESAWLGVHFIDEQHRNVNGDELPDRVNDLTNAPDNCLQLYVVPADSEVKYPSYQHSFLSCGNTTSMAGVCTKLKHGKCLHLHYISFDVREKSDWCIKPS